MYLLSPMSEAYFSYKKNTVITHEKKKNLAMTLDISPVVVTSCYSSSARHEDLDKWA